MTIIQVNVATLLLIAFVAAVGAYFGSYLREEGKNLATHEDIDRLVRTTEEIKAEVSGESWLKQSRWDRKWDCYVEMVKSLGELHTLIHEAINLNAHSSDYAQQLAAKKRAAEVALIRSRQFGSIARIFVAPSVRTVLTRFGDEWNKALGGSPTEQGIVARWGWLVITDIARNDLFGDPREMSDEFVGDVDVKLP